METQPPLTDEQKRVLDMNTKIQVSRNFLHIVLHGLSKIAREVWGMLIRR